MDAFKSRMTLAGAYNLVKCRAFLITLKKATLKWFQLLPPRSISKFSDLSSQFLAHFTTQRFKLKSVTSLSRLSQWQGESLRDFLEHFNMEMLLVEELETQVVVLTLLNELRPRAFKDSLSKCPARTWMKSSWGQKVSSTYKKCRRPPPVRIKPRGSRALSRKTAYGKSHGYRRPEDTMTTLPSIYP